MFMGRTTHEQQGAAQAQGYNQRETNPIVNYDALATASLINSALIDSGSTGATKPKFQSMRTLAAKLSYNTLVPWLQGAALLVADKDDFEAVFHTKDATHKAFMDRCWDSSNKPTEFLRALRRANGNDWDASLQAAAFLEMKKLSQQRESMWSNLPSRTAADALTGVTGFSGQ